LLVNQLIYFSIYKKKIFFTKKKKNFSMTDPTLQLKPNSHFQNNEFTNNGTVVKVTQYGINYPLHQGDHEIIIDNMDPNEWDFTVFAANLEAGTDYYFSFKYYSNIAANATVNLYINNDGIMDDELNITVGSDVNSELKEYVRHFRPTATGEIRIKFANPGGTGGVLAIRDIRLERSFPSPSLQLGPLSNFLNDKYTSNGKDLDVSYNSDDFNDPFKHRYLTQGNNQITLNGVNGSWNFYVKVKIEAHTEYRLSFKYFSNQATNATIDLSVNSDGSDDDIFNVTLVDVDSTEKEYVQNIKPTALASDPSYNGVIFISFTSSDLLNDVPSDSTLTFKDISVDRVHPPTLLQLMPIANFLNGKYTNSGQELTAPYYSDWTNFYKKPIYLTQGNNKFIVNATSALKECFFIQVNLEPNIDYYVAFKCKSNQATGATVDLQIFNNWSDAAVLNVTLVNVDSTEKQYVKHFNATAVGSVNGKTLLHFQTKDAAVGTTLTVENISVGRFYVVDPFYVPSLQLKPNSHFQDNQYTNNGTVVSVAGQYDTYFPLHQGDHEIILDNKSPDLWDFAVYVNLVGGTDYYFSFKYYSSFATTVTENVPDIQIDQDMANNDLLNVTLLNANMELKEYVRRFTATATGDTRIHFKNPGATEGAIAIRDIRVERSFPSPSLQFIPRNHWKNLSQPWGYVNNQYENNGAVLTVPSLTGDDINNPFKHRYLTQGNNKITLDGITVAHSLKVKVKIEAHTEYRLSFKYFSNQANAKLDIKVQNDGSDDDLLQFTVNDIDSTEKQYVHNFKPTALAPFDQDGNSLYNGWMDIAFLLTDVNKDATASLNVDDYFLYKIIADKAYPNFCADNVGDTIIWIGQVTTGGKIQWNWVGSDGRPHVCIFRRDEPGKEQYWRDTYFGSAGVSPSYIAMPTTMSQLDYSNVVHTTSDKQLVAADFNLNNWSTYKTLSEGDYFFYKIIADKSYPNFCADNVGDTIIWIGQVTTGGKIQWDWVGSDGKHTRDETYNVCKHGRIQAGTNQQWWIDLYFGSAGVSPTYIPMPTTISQLDYSNVRLYHTSDKPGSFIQSAETPSLLLAADFSNWSTYKPLLGTLTFKDISVDRVHPPTLLQLMPMANFNTYTNSGQELTVPYYNDSTKFEREPIYLTQGNNKFIVNATSALETCFLVQVDLEPNTEYYVAFKYKSNQATGAEVDLKIENLWSDELRMYDVNLNNVDSTEKQYMKRFTATAVDTYDSANNGKTLVYFQTKDAAVGTTLTIENISVGRFDGIKPVITLIGDPSVTVEVNTTYSDPGATATDSFDGDLTSSIIVGGDTVDMSAPGTYTVTYNVTDAAGNVATKTRTVNVVDTTAPVITLTGLAEMKLHVGTTYTEPGVTATDNNDDEVTVITTGTVDTSTVGVYPISYSASDDAGNAAAVVTRNVIVYNPRPWSQIGFDIVGEALSDKSGYSVSLSSDGKTVAIGAIGNDGTNGTDSGHVRVYQYNSNDGAWGQLGADIDGEASSDKSGFSVSLSSDGSTVAIGAIGNDGDGTNGAVDSGHVRVYKFNGVSWGQLGADIDGELAGRFSSEGDASGFSVSLSSDGSTVAIGAPYNDGTNGTVNSGHVRVYQYNSNDDSWGQLGLSINGETAHDASGSSVSLSSDGKTVAIGAPHNSVNAIRPGHVRVYKYSINDGGWTKLGGDIDGEVEYSQSGSSVSLSSDGSTVAIGTPLNDGVRGYVRVYKVIGGAWTKVGDIEGEADGDLLGYSVSLSDDGSTVAIGAIGNDGDGTNGAVDSGHIRVYKYDGSSSWEKVGPDIDGEFEGAWSGFSVSLSSDGSTVAIGATMNGTGKGHVRVYKFKPPVITLNGDKLVVHQKGTPYTDLGATTAVEDGTITTTGTVDVNTTGTYKITYSATDVLNNTGTKERIIVVSDTDWSQVDLFVWSQVGGDIGDIDGETANDRSGSSVSLSSDGSTVAIGATMNDGNGDLSGHVRVYKYDGSSWGQLGADIDGEAPEDQSGISVSLSSDGSTVAIGATNNDGNGTSSGHVRVYKYDGSSWNQLGVDIDGEALGDKSGSSLSLSSDGYTVAIGAHYNDGNGALSGHVRVYQYDGVSWTKVGADIDGEAASDSSGHSVSLSSDGSIVAIGAITNDDIGTHSGHVRVYKLTDGAWGQLGADIDGEAAYSQLGFSVSLSSDGSIVAIGAPWNDGNGAPSGHVQVYKYDGSSAWNQLGADINGEAEGDYTGWSVSLSSDGYTVAIGAPGRKGRVRLYKYDKNHLLWKKVALDIDGEAADDQSGRSVSLSSDGSTVAIGAPYNDGNGHVSGHVRVYTLTVPPSWSQVGLDIEGELFGDQAGHSVSLSGDGSTVAFGAPFHDVNGSMTNNSGHVRVYQLTDGAWGQLGGDIDAEAAGDKSGWSVSLSSDGSIVAIGAPYNDGNGADSGHVRVYKLTDGAWGKLGDDIDGAVAGDQSGAYVSLSTDGYTVAIGGAGLYPGIGNNSGHVRVYHWINNSWTQKGGLIEKEAPEDYSGVVSLSSDGSILAIGEVYNSNANGAYSGQVRVYQYVGDSWNQLGADIHGEAAGDQSGRSVSLSSDGKTVAIGAPNNGSWGSWRGHVRVYKFIDGAWTQKGLDIDGEASSDYSGAVSLSSDGSIVAIGAERNDGYVGADSGHVRVYKFTDGAWKKVGFDIEGSNHGDLLGTSVSLSSDGYRVAIGVPLGGSGGRVRVYEFKTELPLAVSGYYPLYENASDANYLSSSNSSQSYELNGTTYYMPNGLQPEDRYINDVDGVARIVKMTTPLVVLNGRASKDVAATVNARNALKEEIASVTDVVQKKKKRRFGLKLMFNKNSLLKQIPMTRNDLGLSDKFKRLNVVVFKAGETIDISDVNSNDESFYCSLENKEQVTLSKDGKFFKVRREDTVDGERYAILDSSATSISKRGVVYTAGSYDLEEGDEFSVTFTTETHDFFIGSIGDGTMKPVITLIGGNTPTVTMGGTYTDPGATAVDYNNADLTSSIVVDTSNLNMSVAGDYTVTYNVTDAAGIAADEVTRTVTVQQKVTCGANIVETSPKQTALITLPSGSQSFTTTNGPSNGTLNGPHGTLAGYTHIDYTPNDGFVGDDSLTFTVDDGKSFTVSITVVPTLRFNRFPYIDNGTILYSPSNLSTSLDMSTIDVYSNTTIVQGRHTIITKGAPGDFNDYKYVVGSAENLLVSPLTTTVLRVPVVQSSEYELSFIYSVDKGKAKIRLHADQATVSTDTVHVLQYEYINDDATQVEQTYTKTFIANVTNLNMRIDFGFLFSEPENNPALTIKNIIVQKVADARKTKITTPLVVSNGRASKDDLATVTARTALKEEIASVTDVNEKKKKRKDNLKKMFEKNLDVNLKQIPMTATELGLDNTLKDNVIVCDADQTIDVETVNSNDESFYVPMTDDGDEVTFTKGVGSFKGKRRDFNGAEKHALLDLVNVDRITKNGGAYTTAGQYDLGEGDLLSVTFTDGNNISFLIGSYTQVPEPASGGASGDPFLVTLL
jgi:hypothetical protein